MCVFPLFLVTCILLLIETCAASPNLHVLIVLNTQSSVYSCIIFTDPSVIKYLSPIRFFALTSVGLGLLDL